MERVACVVVNFKGRTRLIGKGIRADRAVKATQGAAAGIYQRASAADITTAGAANIGLTIVGKRVIGGKRAAAFNNQRGIVCCPCAATI